MPISTKATYLESEIGRVQEHNKPLQAEGYKPTIVIGFDGVKTKHLAISFDQLEAIKAILAKGE